MTEPGGPGESEVSRVEKTEKLPLVDILSELKGLSNLNRSIQLGKYYMILSVQSLVRHAAEMKKELDPDVVELVEKSKRISSDIETEIAKYPLISSEANWYWSKILHKQADELSAKDENRLRNYHQEIIQIYFALAAIGYSNGDLGVTETPSSSAEDGAK